MIRASIVVALLCALAAGLAACGGRGRVPQVTIEPLTPTPGASAAGAQTGGKPAAPPATATAAPAPGEPAPPATIDSAPEPPTATSTAGPPDSGRWIDVDVTDFRVRLMDGATVLRAIAPVAVGAQVDTGAYESTQTGLFHVYDKTADLQYDAPYRTYIRDWVGFDIDRANGFHSFLLDKDGQVVDASTGRVSNGCIRTGDPDAIYAFAEIGMPVYVHR
jgi:hypothetical protein